MNYASDIVPAYDPPSGMPIHVAALRACELARDVDADFTHIWFIFNGTPVKVHPGDQPDHVVRRLEAAREAL